MQLYRYFVSHFSVFCHHHPLCCFSTSVYCCEHIFRYRLSQEALEYTLVLSSHFDFGLVWFILRIALGKGLNKLMSLAHIAETF